MDQGRKFRLIAASIIILVAIATAYVTKEFIPTLILSIFLAYLLRPGYAFLLRLTGRKNISSLLSIAITFIVFTSIMVSLIFMLSIEISNLMGSANGILMQSNFTSNATAPAHNISSSIEGPLDKFIPSWVQPYVLPVIAQYTGRIDGFTSGALSWVLQNYLGQVKSLILSAMAWVLGNLSNIITNLISELPIRFAQFLVAIFFTYYILIDGKEIAYRAVDLLPEKNVIHKFLLQLDMIFNTLFGVYFVTSMLSGVLAAVGFLILGISYPLIWGGIIAILTMIPMLGPTVIFIPMAIYFLIIHNYFTAVALLIFGTVFLIIIPENVLRPRLAQQSASIHPIITLLAYTAPVFVLGLMGIIIGPMLYGFLLAAYRTMVDLRTEKEKKPMEVLSVSSQKI